MKLLNAALALSFLTTIPGFSQTPAAVNPAPLTGGPTINIEAVRQTKVVTALRITEEINLDGRLDEPVWQLAIPAGDFYQRLPRNGVPASEKSEVRFLYDDKNLYIGVTAFDSDPAHMGTSELKEDFNFVTNEAIAV